MSASATMEGQTAHALDRAVWRVMDRAKHYGFLAVAVYPPIRPKGYAIYFQTTLDPSGVSWSRMARVHAYADEITEDIVVQAGVHDNRQDTKAFYANVLQNLELFGKLVGPAAFDSMLGQLEVPPSRPDYLSFIGILRGKAMTLGALSFAETAHLLGPAHVFLQAVKQDSVLLPLKGEREAIIHNLRQHCKYLLPGYYPLSG